LRHSVVVVTFVHNWHLYVIFRSKFGQLGPGKGQFNSPHGFCLGMDEDIVVADTNNHRVQIFEKTGDFKYQFGQPGIVVSLVLTYVCYVTVFSGFQLEFGNKLYLTKH